ncbi:hypothetical protein C2G38_2171455 [Gigaspora rosea]|uniref:Uncharacterized protein n=1 Tax=Gigaspora rosea TaxID=44941 RepID=A0A397VND5_9GLOM|nr:hypothetical protein C2G38_2171455 [Gigaspora rosea]
MIQKRVREDQEEKKRNEILQMKTAVQGQTSLRHRTTKNLTTAPMTIPATTTTPKTAIQKTTLKDYSEG